MASIAMRSRPKMTGRDAAHEPSSRKISNRRIRVVVVVTGAVVEAVVEAGQGDLPIALSPSRIEDRRLTTARLGDIPGANPCRRVR